MVHLPLERIEAVTGIFSIHSGLKDRIADRYGDGDGSEEDSSSITDEDN